MNPEWGDAGFTSRSLSGGQAPLNFLPQMLSDRSLSLTGQLNHHAHQGQEVGRSQKWPSLSLTKPEIQKHRLSLSQDRV